MSVDATINWYLWSGSEWTDISPYVLSRFQKSVRWGMRSGNYDDRMAATGEMNLLLNNSDGKFDPDDADSLTGWGKNAIVKMVITYDGVDYVRFRGYVDAITLSDPNQYDMTALVTVLDWMNYAYKYPFTTPSIQLEETGDLGIETIVSNIGRTPQKTLYSKGVNQFDALFDTVDSKTTAAEEINKIVLSELGYFYVRHDKVNGETLVFENASDRNALRTIAQVPKLVADCTALLDESGNAILDEDGNAILADETENARINGMAQEYSRAFGQDIINRVTVSAYPKEVDTAVAVVYKLDSPIKIAPGETKVIKISYQNATTKKSCSVITDSMVQPVVTTDYLMNTNKAGTGTNLSANLTVTATYGTGEGSLTLTNGSAYTGWITKLQCRGFGVYQNDTLEEVVEDTVSQTAYALSEFQVEQKYQRDTSEGLQYARRILEAEKNPRTILKSVTCLANKSSFLMQLFLNIDIGDLIQVSETYNNLSGYYYVNGISASIASNRFIMFTLTLAEAFPAGAELTAVTLDITDTTLAVIDSNYIDFGRINGFLEAEEKTIIISANIASGITSLNCRLFSIGSSDYNTGIKIYADDLETPAKVIALTSCEYVTGVDYWKQEDSAISFDAWNHIAIVYNKKLQQSSCYIGGSIVTFTKMASASGGYLEQSGSIRFGSIIPNADMGLQIKDVKLYNVALTAAEIAEDYAGVPVTRGICFDGPYVKTSDATYYTDHDLVSTDRLIDAVYGYIGTPVIASGGTITTRI